MAERYLSSAAPAHLSWDNGSRFPSMTRARKIALLVAVASFILPSWAAVTGAISGVVKDQTGAVIPAARLSATNTAQGVETKVSTNSNGVYTFPSLPIGVYDLHVDAEGFKPQDRKQLTVDLDATLQIDLTLELAQH